jgi:dihydropyrimidinase
MDCNFIYVQTFIVLYFCCLQSAQNRLLIKNGKVVNEDGMIDSDVYVEDGVIK